ncbi:protein fam18b1-like [Stylonychia lemnae]|uniref:Golgi apparatus membrane protein TVP23 homolog n=1 Tax=Stylonychia lemnae TaxID=5949 RepID=A0A078APA9_STYLE|nr:protein fam18b1-like [Stylonychia lemnae]|eukprot:CDW83157.1 protein fam18b1-like [Stylonychia lemnae]
MLDDLADLDFNISIGGSDYNNFFTQSDEKDGLTEDTSDSHDIENDSTISSITAGSSAKQQAPVAQTEGSTGNGMGIFSTANHPIACLFHILFKGLSFFCFLFLNIFLGNDILAFIFIIIFAAIDFWVVKNVSGRLMVNLRWWSEIDEDGNENWVYESNTEDKEVGTTDSWVFWSALYLTPIIWGLCAVMDLLSFKFFWMNVAIICGTLSSINVSGYYNCKRDHQNKLSNYVQQKAMSYFLGEYMGQALGSVKGMMWSKIPSFLGGQQPVKPKESIFSDEDRQYY